MVRILKAREVPVPRRALLAGALRRVDWSDAHAIACGPDRRGRAFFALVRHVHPVIVRAMLSRAASRLSHRAVRSSARMTE